MAGIKQELTEKIADAKQELTEKIDGVRQEMTREFGKINKRMGVMNWILGLGVAVVIYPVLKDIIAAIWG